MATPISARYSLLRIARENEKRRVAAGAGPRPWL